VWWGRRPLKCSYRKKGVPVPRMDTVRTEKKGTNGVRRGKNFNAGRLKQPVATSQREWGILPRVYGRKRGEAKCSPKQS